MDVIEDDSSSIELGEAPFFLFPFCLAGLRRPDQHYGRTISSKDALMHILLLSTYRLLGDSTPTPSRSQALAAISLGRNVNL